jgi:hypothetical protein
MNSGARSAATTSSRGEQALALARRQWYVFPCHSVVSGVCSCGRSDCSRRGKHPRIREWPTKATRDETTIRHWWTQWPDANIAIATGRSDLLVVDVDPRNGGDESLRSWLGNGAARDLPATYENRTGGGGRHLYFERYGTLVRTRKSFRPGIDIIADTGYVIAAGSAGIASNYICVNDVDPAPIPHWLRAELLKPSSIDSVQPTTEEVDWVATALRGVPEGERNDTAARLAGHFIRRGESAEVVEIVLHDFVARCDGPLMSDSEVRDIAKSIARAEALKREGCLMEISEPLSAFAERVAAQPKRRMLIENLIPEGTVLIHGQPRAGKSLAAVECLVAIATGTPAFGSSAFMTGEPVPVWYVSEEDSAGDVLAAIEGLCRGRASAHLPDNLRLSIWKGLSLDRPESQARIIDTVRRFGIQLVIFDTLRSVTLNADQGPAEFNIIGQFLRRLRRETHGLSILLVHHDTKPGRTGHESHDRPQRASGGALFAFCDSPIHLERVSAAPFRSSVTPTSYKFMTTPPAFDFTLDVSVEGGLRLVATLDVAARTTRRNDCRDRILQFVKANPGLSANTIAKNVRGNRRIVLEEINALVAEGKLVRDARGCSIGEVQAPP